MQLSAFPRRCQIRPSGGRSRPSPSVNARPRLSRACSSSAIVPFCLPFPGRCQTWPPGDRFRQCPSSSFTRLFNVRHCVPSDPSPFLPDAVRQGYLEIDPTYHLPSTVPDDLPESGEPTRGYLMSAIVRPLETLHNRPSVPQFTRPSRCGSFLSCFLF